MKKIEILISDEGDITVNTPDDMQQHEYLGVIQTLALEINARSMTPFVKKIVSEMVAEEVQANG